MTLCLTYVGIRYDPDSISEGYDFEQDAWSRLLVTMPELRRRGNAVLIEFLEGTGEPEVSIHWEGNGKSQQETRTWVKSQTEMAVTEVRKAYEAHGGKKPDHA